MSILETLEELVDELRGSRPSTKHGINEHTLHAATKFSSSLRDHFEASTQFSEDQGGVENKEQALSQARKEMERLKGDIACLKAQLQEM